VGSKYDELWTELLADLRSAIAQAVGGGDPHVVTEGLCALGERATWYGKAEVRGGTVFTAPTAHLRSLANVVTAGGLCAPWPETVFVFTVNADGSYLRVTCQDLAQGRSGPSARPVTPSVSFPSATLVRPMPAETIDIGPTEACARIHALLRRLPKHQNANEVSFSNGLYFFYEKGESSLHAPDGRIVRIGNHPRAQDRLRTRLGDHLRSGPGAKNGSVFRRYLGGALLRRRDPTSACLRPGPGLGHWERQDAKACGMCADVEAEVQAYMTENLYFRCVRIDDLLERNRFEAFLIAAVAACQLCGPSRHWLGLHAYPQTVRASGLWNVQHVDGPSVTTRELDQFAELVDSSPMTPSLGELPSLDRTLLLIPCSASKAGTTDPGLRPVTVADFLGDESKRLLEEGRALSFARKDVTFEEASELRPAIAYYTGQPYATPGVRQDLVGAIRRGLHCLIVSGGYGLLRAEEPIHRYGAYLGNQTRDVWTRRVPTILHDYVRRNGIIRSIAVLSSAYASVLPERLAPEETRIVPSFDRAVDNGSPMRVVPERVGRALADVLAAL